MVIKRDQWTEWSDGTTLALVGRWSADRETLLTAARETGWFDTLREASEAVDNVSLVHTWYGVNDDADLELCDEHGMTSAGDDLGPHQRITIAEF